MKTIAQFMQDAMYDKASGYYITGNPIGKDRDFITAPEISQLFGEMIGVYCADQWIKMGSPEKFNLIELGPGRATLMMDLQRATKNIAGFSKACQIHLVETNRQHIEIQKQQLNAVWHQDVTSLPTDVPMLVIANEFFDCLPIHQYIYEKNHWHERYIEDKKFFNLLVSPELNSFLLKEYSGVLDGAIVEVSYQAREIIKHFSKCFNKVPGCLLIIDYGYEQNSAYGSSLQAIKNHQFHSIFEDVGQVDLTAHVDFAALKKEAIINGCSVIGSVTQSKFLNDLGIEFRAAMLKKNANAEQQKDLDSGLYRLIDKSQMGSLFKVMSIHSHI